MRKIIIAMLGCALLLQHSASAQDAPAEVLGFVQGDAIPEADRSLSDVDNVMREVSYPGKAGFDRISVIYTENQGVCAVAAMVHDARIDKLAKRVEKKLGNPPTKGRTLFSKISYAWHDEDARPFLRVVIAMMR